ncbi:hypothetical protein D3C71_1333500 [compost metagenome]
MGQRRRHLPEGGKFGRLHQAFLGGAQVAGAFFHQLLKLLAAALAKFGQTPALVEEQQQKHQCQPQTGCGECGVAAVFEGNMRTAQ